MMKGIVYLPLQENINKWQKFENIKTKTQGLPDLAYLEKELT